MDLGQLGNLGELIGGVAVVASLLFVGLQIRHNTRALRQSNFRDVSDGLRQSLLAVTSDAELAEIVLRGMNDLSSLEAVERYRLDMLLLGWLNQFELACTAEADGFFPRDNLVVFRTTVAAWLSTPGGAAWWGDRRVWFGNLARAAVDSALADESLDHRQSGPAALNRAWNSAVQMAGVPFWHQPFQVQRSPAALFNAAYRRSVGRRDPDAARSFDPQLRPYRRRALACRDCA